MSEPKPSLVEVLENLRYAAFQASISAHVSEHGNAAYWLACKRTDTIEDILTLAAPYAKRLAALERVFEAAKDLSDGGDTLGGWIALKVALAAVPEIPENPT